MERHIRIATTADAPELRSIYGPVVESTPISFELAPPSTEETAERVETTLPQYP